MQYRFTKIYEHNIVFWSIQELAEYLRNQSNAVVFIDKQVFQDYSSLILKNTNLPYFVMDIKEHQKNLSTAEYIWQILISNKITRHHNVIIIGGGVLNDVVLFACSVFKRGLNCISVPTTLLSMVDASIGGKNAVNLDHIKNTLGTLHIPIQNIIVKDFLSTLSKEQLLSGWAEILKIALVKDAQFYNHCIHYLQKNLLPDRDIIKTSIQLKLDIIQNDIDDSNDRQLLNYGHTIAHAIEGYFEDQNIYIPHGYAVILGILIENAIAEKLNLLHTSIKNKIEQDLEEFYSYESYPITADVIPILLSKIQQDKKNTATALRFTLIEDIGKGKIKVEVSTQLIEEVLKEILSE